MKKIGVDIGTMNLVVSQFDSENNIQDKSIRNVFLEVDNIGSLDLSKITHSIIDNRTIILSEDAYNFANIFGQEVKRPMKNGLISSSEFDAIDIMTVMLKYLLGPAESQDDTCVYSCPASSLDADNNVLFHQEVIKRIIHSIGYTKVEPINEAVAIVYSSCSDTNFTGLSISYGAGMTNMALVYKSIPILQLSVNRGGDYIDHNVANSTNQVYNRVTLIKESPEMNLSDFTQGKKREMRIREAIVYYYKDLISYTINSIIDKLSKLTDIQLPESLPIIISGGTSKVNGFMTEITNIINSRIEDFPFTILEVKQASDPLVAVAHGCLIKASTI